MKELERLKKLCGDITPFDSKDNLCTRDQEFYIEAWTMMPRLIEALEWTLGQIDIDNTLYEDGLPRNHRDIVTKILGGKK